MEPKLLLMHSLLLLYWERKALGGAGDNRASIAQAIETMPLPEDSLELDETRDIMHGLRYLVLELCEEEVTAPIDSAILKQRIKLCCLKDVDFYETIIEGLIDTDADETAIIAKCVAYGKAIGAFNKKKDFEAAVRKMVHTALWSGTSYNVRELAVDMQSKLDVFSVDATGNGPEDTEGVLSHVDLTDPESVAALFREGQEELSPEGVLRTGYQAINDMLGDYGGIRRGDTLLVGALQHNYKTGFTLNLTRHIAIYNKPHMLKEKKKPMIIHISSENALTDNLMLMYQGFKENENSQEFCDTNSVDPEIAAAYIAEKSMINGYHMRMLKVNPSNFTYTLLFQMINAYEALGYEIHLLTIDYLNMFNKSGCTNTTIGSDTRDLFRRVRNFTHSKKIAFITPHQISSDAKRLLRSGISEEDFVKEIANKGYYDGCTVIDQEVDIEILIHIVKRNGRSYLMCQRGKHRKSGKQTDDKYLCTTLPFYPIGAVRDDVNGENEALNGPGGRRISRSDSEEESWDANF